VHFDAKVVYPQILKSMDHIDSRHKAARPAGVRAANRATVLQQLRLAQPLSRAEVARRSGISEGTVSRLVAELLEEKLVVEAGAESTTGGRPGTRLLLDSTYLRTIGVEIQNWETRLAVGTLDGKLLESTAFRSPDNPAEALEMVARKCRELSSEMEPGRLEGIGVAARGVVDNEAGVVKIGNSKEWNGVEVRAFLESALHLPIYVENNVRTATLAEYNAGSPDVQGNHCLLLVCVDEGIGAGIILDGALYRGCHMAAGEMGEMLVAGPQSAEARGRLEVLGSNPAICDRYAELTESARRPRLGETRGRVRTICHAAMQGDGAARQALSECCHYLGIGISNLAAMFDPDVVILDGAITSAWPLVLEALQRSLADLNPPNLYGVAIRPGALGADAALIGAMLLPLDPVFSTGKRAGSLADAGVAGPLR
jgi:predicted NBD/HSP70 family sugar kinase